jgi:hypothetical protein
MSYQHRAKKRPWEVMITSILFLCALSWLKFGITENIRVDHNPYPGSWSYAVFFVFCGALVLFGLYYWKLIWKTQHTQPHYKVEAYVILFLASLMVPFLSNDVIIYLGHGYLSNHGVDVFSNIGILKDSAWAPYIHDWKDGPFVYGPVNLIPAKLANTIGGENLWLTFIVYKCFMILVGIGIIEILQRIIKDPRDLLIAILAPAFWLHNVGHLHNDLIACLFVLASVYFITKAQLLPAAIFMGISISCKVSVVLYVPFIFVYYYFTSTQKLTQRIITIFSSLILFILSIAACYAIFWRGSSSIQVPFEYLSQQQSTKSFSEILGEILNVIFSGVNRANIESEVAMEEVAGNDPKIYWWTLSKNIFNIVGLIMFVVTGVIFWIKTKLKFTKEQIIELFIKFNLIFFFYYLHIFQAWYLVILIPLIALSTNERLKKYFMVLCCYSGVHTIIITIARPSALFYVLPVLVIFNCCLFVWQFKKNFLTVEASQNEIN